MLYTQKLVVYGKHADLYTYKKAQKKFYKKILTLKNLAEAVGLIEKPKYQSNIFIEHHKKVEKTNFSIQRTRTAIRRIVNGNEFDKFHTLTFGDNILDIDTANKHFKKFIQRLNYAYPNTKYIAVIERQKERGQKNNDIGTIHYHMLSDLPYIDIIDFSLIWNGGFCWVNKISHIRNLGSYISKYLNKEAFDGTMKYKKKYHCSKNLELPREFIHDDYINYQIKSLNINLEQPVHNYVFDSQYTGEVEYKKYEVDINYNK